MARLDPEYAELKAAVDAPNASAEDKQSATSKLEAREKHLVPAYQSIALEFADLHDRSGRMKAKANCIPCDWENSRRAIYWSLRRRLSEVRILKKLATANPTLTYPERKALMAELVPADLITDSEVAGFIEKSGDVVESYVQSVRDAFCSDSILSWA